MVVFSNFYVKKGQWIGKTYEEWILLTEKQFNIGFDDAKKRIDYMIETAELNPIEHSK